MAKAVKKHANSRAIETVTRNSAAVEVMQVTLDSAMDAKHSAGMHVESLRETATTDARLVLTERLSIIAIKGASSARIEKVLIIAIMVVSFALAETPQIIVRKHANSGPKEVAIIGRTDVKRTVETVRGNAPAIALADESLSAIEKPPISVLADRHAPHSDVTAAQTSTLTAKDRGIIAPNATGLSLEQIVPHLFLRDPKKDLKDNATAIPPNHRDGFLVHRAPASHFAMDKNLRNKSPAR